MVSVESSPHDKLLTHADGASTEEDHTAYKIDDFGPSDRHDLAEKANETGAWYKERAIQECELFPFFDFGGVRIVVR